ncbi:uncharacterized protein LOC124353966 isoform X2 [Homalodisca vitripennis]|uniref:uncharacterized protein LOC124353966 isoform X2 n=1 Tax=Homalodisca vitripennis TaxID=197043 RepID=UPI001EEA6DE7|nr:uncharacterized protein LOC124353966 isoform X2 [Homalodisca vitripennis]
MASAVTGYRVTQNQTIMRINHSDQLLLKQQYPGNKVPLNYLLLTLILHISNGSKCNLCQTYLSFKIVKSRGNVDATRRGIGDNCCTFDSKRVGCMLWCIFGLERTLQQRYILEALL